MKKKYQTELLGALHETAAGLHKIGVINSEEMREYDEDCLVHGPETDRIKMARNNSAKSKELLVRSEVMRKTAIFKYLTHGG